MLLKFNDIDLDLAKEEDVLFIYELYKEKQSLRAVAKLLNTNKDLIARTFKKFNIPYLTRVEATQEYSRRLPKKVKVHTDAKETCLARYGVDNIFKLKSVHDKGVQKKRKAFLARLDKRLEEAECIMLEPFTHTQDENGKYIFYKFQHKCGHVFTTDLRRDIKCPVCFPINRFSSFEKKYKDFLTTEDIPIICNKKINNIYEIDIRVENTNIGFELNGTYWHSVEKKGRNYHADKTQYLLKEGINVYQFWDYQDTNIIKSIMLSKLGKSSKTLYGRKLALYTPTVAEARKFFNENHLDGFTKSLVYLALITENKEIVSMISIRRNCNCWEIARFANKIYYNVCGGFSKLYKHVIPILQSIDKNIDTVISYCNRDIAPDYKNTVYYKNGFEFKGDTGSILKYFNRSTETVESRQKYQRHLVKEMFEDFNEAETTDENLIRHKIYPIRNSGNWKFIYKIGENE